MKYWGLGIAGALFYAAPIGAGLTGAPYVAALAFAGLFFLWIMVMRHEPFRDGPAMIMPTLILHFPLASACLGFGHLLRVFLGVEATAPLLAWLIMGLGAIGLGRILWQPRREAEAEAFAEKALKALNEFAGEAEELLDEREEILDAGERILLPYEAEALAAMFGKLDALPEEAAAQEDLQRIVLPVVDKVYPRDLFRELERRARTSGARRDRHALLVLATDPDFLAVAAGGRPLEGAFDLIVEAADTVTLAHFLHHAESLLDEAPRFAAVLPDVRRMLEIAGQIEADHPELSEGLVRLAQIREDIELEMDPNG